MKSLLLISLLSGFVGLASVARAQTEPQQLDGAPIDRPLTEAGNADCESGTCGTQNNGDLLTDNQQADNARARAMAGNNGGVAHPTGSSSDVTD